MIFSRRIGFRLFLTAIAGSGLLAAGLFWSSLRSVEALFTENRRLHESLGRLQEESVVGYLWLLSRNANEEGTRTTAVWMEPAAGQPESSAKVETLSLEGRTLYLDGFVVRFPSQLVADGKARALILWRRAFGDDQAPNAGVALDDGQGAPRRYEAIFSGAFTPAESSRFWEALWGLAHDPDGLADLGIQAVYGNALAIEPRPGYLYTVRLSATGALWVEPSPMEARPDLAPAR